MCLALRADVVRPPPRYEPRAPAQSVLYQIVRDHFETFRAQAGRVCEGEGLPRFIAEEFEGFLQCGWLAGGFARFQCAGCGLDRLVAFSCKSRAVCPSCGGRRMAERSNLLWAQLMARSFGFDVLACPWCGGRLRLIALIEDPRVIRRILGHLGLPTEVPAARPPRAPPIRFEPFHDRAEDDISVP